MYRSSQALARPTFALVALLSVAACGPLLTPVAERAPGEAVSDTVLVGAGDIARCPATGAMVTAALLARIDGTVFAAGDNAYDSGSAAEYAQCYAPTWGYERARTRPTPGNHDYQSPGAAPYFTYFGANAGPAGRGYYSYDLGAWHILSLNSNVAADASSPQMAWIRTDLGAHPSTCALAYWHHPVFSSGTHGNNAQMAEVWRVLDSAGVDVLIVGHDHDYERFGPQSPHGEAAPRRGIREFVVGTGGMSHYPWGSIRPNSQVRNNRTFGVLALTLHQTSYDWRFLPEPGYRFADAGHASCHGAPPTSSTAIVLAVVAVLLCALCLGGLSLAVRFSWLRGATR